MQKFKFKAEMWSVMRDELVHEKTIVVEAVTQNEAARGAEVKAHAECPGVFYIGAVRFDSIVEGEGA